MEVVMAIRYYSESHEWIDFENGVATVGITRHAAEELGEIVYVELCDEEDSVANGSEFGSLESVKTVSGLFAPVSGEISAVNSAVVDSPELISDSPEGEGWLVKISVSEAEELEDLMDEVAYQAFCEQ